MQTYRHPRTLVGQGLKSTDVDAEEPGELRSSKLQTENALEGSELGPWPGQLPYGFFGCWVHRTRGLAFAWFLSLREIHI